MEEGTIAGFGDNRTTQGEAKDTELIKAYGSSTLMMEEIKEDVRDYLWKLLFTIDCEFAMEGTL